MSDNLSKQFEQDVQEMVDWLTEVRPGWGSGLGLHKYDDYADDDLSLTKLDAEKRKIAEYEKKFEKGLASSDIDTQIDAEMIITLTKTLRDFEGVSVETRGPQSYIGRALGRCHKSLVGDYAPLPTRLKSLLLRLKEVPRILEQGKQNLQRPPKVWTEIAVGMAKGGESLFGELIPSVAQEVPELSAKINEASEKALEAVRDYLRFLNDDLLPKSDSDYAIGEASFNRHLKEIHMLDVDAAELERIGWRMIDETEKQFDELAASLGYKYENRNEVIFEISKHHPTEEGLIDAYAKAMADSREFIMERDLMTLPPGESMQMKEHPKYIWHLAPFAGYGPPGIFEKEQTGTFWVTPVDPELPPDMRELRLRSHPYAKIPIHAVHEGYPGHHVQLVWGNLVGSLARKISCVSTLHEEGWAFYTEELMEKQGFLDNPSVKLFRLKEQLWRASRIVIDVGLHTRGMTVEEGVQLFINKAGFERPDAVAEVTRYTLCPGQPMSYLIGKLELLKTAEEYKRRKGADFNLKTFHDEVLHCGSLTPKLLRKRLFTQ